MTDMFATLPARSELPFRRRAGMPATARRFRSEAGFECFLTPDAVERLLEGTRRARPNEAFALLFGRAFHDEAGEYAVVNGVHHPTSFARGPGHVSLTPAQAAAARAEGARCFPAEDAVGWSHSHGWDSGYSRTDRDEQRTWPSGHHVGILTFMAGPPWMRAYHGPWAGPMAEVAPTPPDGETGPCWITGWARPWCDCPDCTQRRSTG